MNHAYRLVWNEAAARYVPAPETAKGRGKSSGRSAIVTTLCAALLGSSVWASPVGGTVSTGSGSITQSSQNLAINWASFSTSTAKSVNFVQPTAARLP